jgi:hypothetical protein
MVGVGRHRRSGLGVLATLVRADNAASCDLLRIYGKV